MHTPRHFARRPYSCPRPRPCRCPGLRRALHLCPLPPLLLLLALLLPCLPAPSLAASLRAATSFRRLDDDDDHHDHDHDDGSAPNPAPTPTAGNCTFQFQGATVNFSFCASLDSAGKYILAWTPTSENAFSVFFQGTPQAPYGWAGWGVSPDGKMAGSYDLIGYGSATDSSRSGGNLYYIADRTPATVPLTQANGHLTVTSTALQTEVADSGTVVRLLADVSGLGSAAVNVIWAGGPSADISTGTLSPHDDKSTGSATVNFASASSAGTGSGSSSAAPSSSTPSPTATSTNTSSNCTFQFQGSTVTFSACTNLDSAGKYSLAWTQKSAGVFSVLYQGVPMAPYGWAGWGISPDGKMAGSYDLVGFGNANDPTQTAANLYSIPKEGPTKLPLTSTGGLLTVASSQLAVEVANSGATVRILADVSSISNGAVNVIWAGGPSADISTGTLTPHDTTTNGATTVNFYAPASSASAGSSPSGSDDGDNDNNSTVPPSSQGTVTGTSSSNCNFQFQGTSQSFSQCVALDASGKFTLAWSPMSSSSSSAYTVLFQGTPESAYGWAGWGISPTGLMDGSNDLVGYGDASSTAQSGAHLYHISGRTATAVSPNQTNGLLGLASGTVGVEVAASGTVVRLLADVTIPSSGQVNVIWAGGPSADISTGQLAAHGSTTTGSVKLDFAEGLTSASDMTTSNSNQKIIHAWLAGIGFGVLMPLGILVARHVKLWADPLWYYSHIAIQLAGYTLGGIGFGFGVWLKLQFGDIAAASETQIAHYVIGIVMFSTSSLQVMTPVLKPAKTAPARLYWNLAHWALGYTTIILAFVNTFLGFNLLASESLSYGPWRTVYIVFLCLWGALLLLLEPISWHLYFKKVQEEEALREPQKPAPDQGAHP